MKAKVDPRVVLQQRDTEILRALFACRYLTTAQIQRAFFGRNRSVVCARLNKKLLPHGFILRHFRDVAFQHTDAVYSVGRAGIRLLAEVLRAEPQVIARGVERQTEPLFLRHLLEVNDLWVALRAATGEDHASCALRSWWTEKKLRGLHRPARADAPIPDSRFVLGYRDGARAHFFVEVDRGTESPRIFQDKVKKYLAYFVAGGHERDFGVKTFRVLTVAPDERRLGRLLEAAAAAGANNIFLFAPKGEIAAAGIFGRIWVTPRDRYALVPGDGGRVVAQERERWVERRYTIAE